MSALQWALLILSVVIVVAIVALSRRERPPRAGRILSDSDAAPMPTPRPGAEQMDIFARSAEGDEARTPVGSFDEFGVGKARKRQAPLLGEDDPYLQPAPAADLPPAQPMTPPPEPEPVAPARPLFAEADAPPAVAPEAAPEPAPEAPRPPSVAPPPPAFLRAPSTAAPAAPKSERIVTLLIAERDGVPILGTKIHTALKAQGLVYGARKVYHRLSGETPVFSVASLVKPGELDPEHAASFSTPGLSVFMVLPGPVQPVVALQDMMTTAQTLARSLNAEVYDSRKQPLNADAMRELQNDVEAWWRGQ